MQKMQNPNTDNLQLFIGQKTLKCADFELLL